MKGSLYGRRTIDPTLGYNADRTIALKDQDFLDKKEKIKIGHANKRRIMQIIEKDSAFFNQENIIDYSLLVGVHNRSEHPQDFANNHANADTR